MYYEIVNGQIVFGGSEVTIGSDLTIGQDLDVARDASIGDDLSVVDEITIGGLVTSNGPVKIHRTEVSSGTKTVQSDEYLLGVTYTATGPVLITLPSADASRTIVVVDEGANANTNNITIQTVGLVTVATITTDGGAKMFYSDGTNWFAV